jgi:GT2 family glycosyltransferase
MHTTVIIITNVQNDESFDKTVDCFKYATGKSVNQYAPHNYEVMIVDNNSNAKFKEWLKWLQGCYPGIKIIYNNENYKFSKAVNQGLLQASMFSDYVIVLHSDTRPRDGWLHSLVQVAESDPKIAMVGVKVMKPGTDLVLNTGVILKDGKVINAYPPLISKKLTTKKLVEERLWVDCCCMLFRPEIVNKFGVFNDTDFPQELGEADYGIRLHQAGYRVVYAPMVEIEHFHKSDTEENLEPILTKHSDYLKWQQNIDGTPRVAIVMPTYNSEKFIKRTMDSVLNQTYPNLRLYVVDDGSMDKTTELLFKYKEEDKENKLFIITKDKNEGTPIARNHALNTILWNNNQERFKYIFFLDSDDVWNSNYLEKMVYQFEQDQKIDMIYCMSEFRFENGAEAVPYGIPQNVTVFDKELMLKQNYISPSFVGLKASVVEKIGRFAPELSGIEDWDYWSRIANAGLNIYCYPEVLGTYTVRENSNAASGNEDKLKLLRERQSNGKV